MSEGTYQIYFRSWRTTHVTARKFVTPLSNPAFITELSFCRLSTKFSFLFDFEGLSHQMFWVFEA
jgi:hypothetical protein